MFAARYLDVRVVFPHYFEHLRQLNRKRLLVKAGRDAIDEVSDKRILKSTFLRTGQDDEVALYEAVCVSSSTKVRIGSGRFSRLGLWYLRC